jgi:hypothetical protein
MTTRYEWRPRSAEHRAIHGPYGDAWWALGRSHDFFRSEGEALADARGCGWDDEDVEVRRIT